MKPQELRNNSSFQSTAVWGELAIISSSGVEKQCMHLSKYEYTMGRSRRCDVKISIKTVSRTHARIQRNHHSSEMTLTNCGSGEDDLFLNKTLIKPSETVQLNFGDVIKLSGKVFKLYCPRGERSEILDDTLLCSQNRLLKNMTPHPAGGVRDTRCLPQPIEVTETKFNAAESALKGKASSFGWPKPPSFRNSPARNSSSDLLLGTPDIETNKTIKSVRFSQFNQVVEADGIQVLSPAPKRRKLAERKPTPCFGRTPRSEFPPEWSRFSSVKKRLINRKQVLKTKSALKNQGSHCMEQKLSLTPSVKHKSEEQRRKEIMTLLLASSPELETVNEQPSKNSSCT